MTPTSIQILPRSEIPGYHLVTNTRGALIDAGIAVMHRRGYATSVADIVEAAGVLVDLLQRRAR